MHAHTCINICNFYKLYEFIFQHHIMENFWINELLFWGIIKWCHFLEVYLFVSSIRCRFFELFIKLCMPKVLFLILLLFSYQSLQLLEYFLNFETISQILYSNILIFLKFLKVLQKLRRPMHSSEEFSMFSYL